MSNRYGIDFDIINLVLSTRPEEVVLTEKAGWLKLECNGNRMYVQKARKVREIHLSGFGEGWVGTKTPDVENGSVQAHVDLEDPNVLDHISMLLIAMTTLPEFKVVRRKKAVTSSRPVATLPPSLVDADAATRLAAIKAIHASR